MVTKHNIKVMRQFMKSECFVATKFKTATEEEEEYILPISIVYILLSSSSMGRSCDLPPGYLGTHSINFTKLTTRTQNISYQ